MVDGIRARRGPATGVRGARASTATRSPTMIQRGLASSSPTSRRSPRSTSTRCSPRPDGAIAVDVAHHRRRRGRAGPAAALQPGGDPRPSMNRMMQPRAIAVIGASDEEGKIGNSVMKNLVNGGFAGEIYPINPKADEILGKKAYASVADVPGERRRRGVRDPGQVRRRGAREGRRQGHRRRDPDPVRLRRDRRDRSSRTRSSTIAREHGVRLLGPNIYGYYYLPENMCATFCTPYDVQGAVSRSPRRAAGSGWRSSGSAGRRRWASRRSSGSATRPTSTRTTC